MRALLLAGVVAVSWAGPAEADPVFYSDPSLFMAATSSVSTETFSSINPGVGNGAYLSAPLSNSNAPGLLPGVTYGSGGGYNLFVDGSNYSSIGNQTVLLTTSVIGDTLQLIFSTPVTAVGFNLYSEFSSGPVTVTIRDTSGLTPLLLQAVSSTGGGTFVGTTDQVAISEVDVFGAQYVDIGLLRFGATATAVPEPASLALLGVGVAAVAAVRRRQVG